MIFSEYWLWFAIPGLILGFYAQMKLSSTYSRFIQVPNQQGITGAQAAREILDQAGLRNMPIHEVGGHLSNHYDPMKRALSSFRRRISTASQSRRWASRRTKLATRWQHQTHYGPLKFRMMMVPATQFASWAWMGITVLGMILGGAFFHKFLGIAIGIFAVLTLFQIVTLRVEFDASKRAKEQLLRLGLISPQENGGVSKVLNAAAMTYVAAMVSSVMQLLHLVMLCAVGD